MKVRMALCAIRPSYPGMPAVRSGFLLAIAALQVAVVLCVRVDDDARPAVSEQVKPNLQGSQEIISEEDVKPKVEGVRKAPKAKTHKKDDKKKNGKKDKKKDKTKSKAKAKSEETGDANDYAEAADTDSTKVEKDAAEVENAKEKLVSAQRGVTGAVAVQTAMAKAAKDQNDNATEKNGTTYHTERHPLYTEIQQFGLARYDLDGSGALNIMELRALLHDLSPTHPMATSDAEVQEVMETHDEDDSHSLGKSEVLSVILKNPIAVKRLAVPFHVCNGWSPESGEDAGNGATCDKWGWQNTWCWIPANYQGPGSSHKLESELHPTKFFAMCAPDPDPAPPPPPPPVEDDYDYGF